MTRPQRHPDSLASEYIPPEAVLAWCNDTHIFIAIPASKPNVPPLIQSYAKTEGGLTKALTILHKEARLPAGTRQKLTGARTVLRDPKVSDAQRAAARAVLRKMGF